MTVNTNIKKVRFGGNDAATTFSFSPMVITSEDDIEVWKLSGTTVTQITKGTGSTNFSVSVASYPGTGSIVYPASGGTPLATGETLVAYRKRDLLQETDLFNQGGYFPETQEAEYDKRAMIDLQQQDQIDRSVKGPVTDDPATLDMTLPAAAARANKYIAFDADGNPTAITGTATDADISDKLVLLPDNDEQETLANLLSNHGKVINVRAFGATGDGITDDADAFVAAFAALTDDATLYVPPGHYLLASATVGAANSFKGIDIPANNVRIIGSGREQTIMEMTGSTKTGFLYFVNKTGLEMSGIHFKGNNEADADSSQGSAITATLLASATANMENINIHDCEFTEFKGAGWVRIDNRDDEFSIKLVQIRRNRFSGGGDINATATVAANQIYFVTTGTEYIEDYWITDNYCDANNCKMGVSLQNRTRRGNISRNVVVNAGQASAAAGGVILAYGISVYNNGEKVTVSDNVVIDAYTTGFYMLDLVDATISGNYVEGQEETNISTLDRAGIVVTHGNRVSITGNSVRDCVYGIMLRPGADNAFVVSGNITKDCLVGAALRVNSLATYTGSVISGNHFHATNSAFQFRLSSGFQWNGLIVSNNRFAAANGPAPLQGFNDGIMSGNLFETTSRAINIDNTVGGALAGERWMLLHNKIIGDHDNVAVQANNASGWHIEGLHFYGQSTAACWLWKGTPPVHLSGVTFFNVTTPTTTTGSVDIGVDAPTTTTNLTNGAFIQKLVPTKDANGRVQIGWRLLGGTWEAEFVSTATWV